MRNFKRLALLTTFALLITAGAFAQSSSPVTVDEVHSQATIADHLIHFHLALTHPADENTQATAWILSPQGKASGKISADIAEGATTADFALPLPDLKRNEGAETLAWYRIAYRVEDHASDATTGIVSIGAVTPNLFVLRLFRPENVIRNQPLGLRVLAVNPATDKPRHHVHLIATVTYNGEDKQHNLHQEASTNAHGEAIFSLPITASPGATGTITVTGTYADANAANTTASIESEIEIDNHATMHLETDKPLHKPGEVVHLRALVFNDAHRAAPQMPLHLSITDDDGNTIAETKLTTNKFGVAAYDWKTTTQTSTGDYDVKLEPEDDSNFEGAERLRLHIQRYELPQFRVTATTDRDFYLKGQQANIHLHAEYLFGKPVPAATVRLVRVADRHWDATKQTWIEEAREEKSGMLDSNGDLTLSIDLTKEFKDLHTYSRFKDVRFKAIVTDPTTERSEPRTFMVRISRDPLHVYILSVSGNQTEGDYYIATSSADGKPVACKLTLEWMEKNAAPQFAASVSSNRYGIAKIHLRYPEEKSSTQSGYGLRISARDEQGRTTVLDDTTYPQQKSIYITVDHSLLKAGEPILATVHGSIGSLVDLNAFSERGLLDHQQVQLNRSEEQVRIPVLPSLHGRVTLWASDAHDDPESTRYSRWNNAHITVLYPQDRSLQLEVRGLQKSYLPGSNVALHLELNAAEAAPQPGVVGASVVDTAVQQRAETEEMENSVWYGGWWGDSYAGVAGLSLADLNKTVITDADPVPDDLELAAEAFLLGSQTMMGTVEFNSASAVRAEYTILMQHNLSRIRRAIFKARPLNLPRMLDEISAFAPSERLPLDPWHMPYQAAFSSEWRDEVVTMKSAGPDKTFNTADDFSVDLVRRNIFAIPGKQLTDILQSTAKEGQPLPGNVAQLHQFAQAHGLDLDTLRDPDGKPFTYRVNLRDRYLTVSAFRTSSAKGSEYWAQIPIWTSPDIDYFAATELKMDAAIKRWMEQGNPFPATVEEARKAFANYGIASTALQDPTGKPLEIESTEVAAYTSITRVTGGTSLSSHSKSVTQKVRAVRIVRKDSLNNHPQTQILAEFLYPITEQSGLDTNPVRTHGEIFNPNTGAIGGTVTDTSGATVLGASITLKRSSGEILQSVQSQKDGTYQITGLHSGFYTVEVSARGFNAFVVREVVVAALARTTLDVQLTLGSVMESVEVSAQSLVLETETSSRQQIVSGSKAKASIVPPPSFTPRLRHTFEETAYWAPSIELDNKGRGTISFKMPDSLTTWNLHALASTEDGRITTLDKTFQTFQPFFVDLDTPPVLTIGDRISVPAVLRNYTPKRVSMRVTSTTGEALQLLSGKITSTAVPANGSVPTSVSIRAAHIADEATLRVTATHAATGDAIEKKMLVHPDGEPLEESASTLLSGKQTSLDIDLPAQILPNSTHAVLTIHPDLGSHIMRAMQAVLHRPYGCGEQTISSTYPSLLYLELLKQAGAKGDPAKAAEAKDYLHLGYERLLNYITPDGGITYWGGSDRYPDAALTAYGVEFLLDAQKHMDVDKTVIANALHWLIKHQHNDGAWFSHYNTTDSGTNLYIASVLLRASKTGALTPTAPSSSDIASAVKRAQAWSATSAAALHDPYALALRLRLAEDQNANTVTQQKSELLQLAVHTKDGVHWAPSGMTPFYSWGRAGEIGTTANVLQALQHDTESVSVADQALFFLLRNQDREGTWLSGQVTVRVLQAFLPLAVRQLKNPSARSPLHVTVNGSAVSVPALDSADAPIDVDLSQWIKSGHNHIGIDRDDNGSAISAGVGIWSYTPWHDSQTSKTKTSGEAGLDFEYHCDPAAARVAVPIDCTVRARRFGSIGYGMLLAEVGLPPGAEVDRAELADLISRGEIARYELQPDHIVFYLWPDAEGSRFRFHFTPRYSIQAKTAPSKLSDYYNPELFVTLAPQTVHVTGRR